MSIQRTVIKKRERVNILKEEIFKENTSILSERQPMETTEGKLMKIYTNINLATYEILIMFALSAPLMY